MKRLVWSRSARRQLEQLNDWYAELNPDLPLEFTIRIETALTRLLDLPHIGSPVPDSTSRKWRVRRTPYLIFYRATREGISILKVRHTRSDWKVRDRT